MNAEESDFEIDENKRIPGVRILFAAASTVVIIAGLKSAQSILIPFLFALLLAMLGSWPLLWLKKIKVPTGIAVVLVAALMIILFMGIGTLLAVSAEEFTLMLPTYRDKLVDFIGFAAEWLRSHGIPVSQQMAYEAVNPESMLNIATGTFKGIIGAFSGTVLVLVIMSLMLLEAAVFRLKSRAALEDSVDMESIGRVAKDIQRYLAMKTFTSMVTGVLIWLWTSAMGVEFAVLWGLIGFILNYIPFVGSIIAAIPACILTLITGGVGISAILTAGYILINIGVSNFFEPILMGRRLGLSPLVVFLSLVFWGWVWGPGGMLLSVPLTMVVKIFLEHSDDFRWIAVLMDVRPRRIRTVNVES